MAEQPRSLTEALEDSLPLNSNRAQIEAISKRRERPLLAIVLAPDAHLNRKAFPPLLEVLDEMGDLEDADVLLQTLGGASEETWRLVSTLRGRLGNYTAIVPFAASPGATQVALGADRLLMGDASSLAPLEPAHLRTLDVSASAERLPVTADDVHWFIEFLRSHLRIEGEISLDSPALAHLLDRVDPLTVGATERARRFMRLLMRRTLETHLDRQDDAERIDRVVDRMTGGYLSHRFPVTRRDCEHDLELTVERPEQSLWKDIWELTLYYEQMLELEGDLRFADRHFRVEFDGFIDTATARRVLVRVTRVDDRGRARADRPAFYRWIRPGSQDVELNTEVSI
jgi:hypothetical protein